MKNDLGLWIQDYGLLSVFDGFKIDGNP